MATYAKSAKTREHLFQTALNLFLSQGYHATSLKDIAEAGGVSTGTLYRYFPSKSDLLFEIRRRSQAHLHEVAEQLPETMPLAEKLYTIILEDDLSVSHSIDLTDVTDSGDPRMELALAARCETYRSLRHLEEEEHFRKTLRSIYQSIIEGEQARGALDPSLDAAEASEVVSALYFQAIDQAILHPGLDVAASIRPKLDMLFPVPGR